MRYSADQHAEIEAINDMMMALHARMRAYHATYGDVNKYSEWHHDTSELACLADDLDGYQHDIVSPLLNAVRAAYEIEHAEYDCMEADESAMLRFRQAGVR